MKNTTFISLIDQKHSFGSASWEKNGKLLLILDFKEKTSELILSAIEVYKDREYNFTINKAT